MRGRSIAGTGYLEAMCTRAGVAVAIVAVLAALPASATASPQAGKRQWIDCTAGHLRGAAPYSVWASHRSGQTE